MSLLKGSVPQWIVFSLISGIGFIFQVMAFLSLTMQDSGFFCSPKTIVGPALFFIVGSCMIGFVIYAYELTLKERSDNEKS